MMPPHQSSSSKIFSSDKLFVTDDEDWGDDIMDFEPSKVTLGKADKQGGSRDDEVEILDLTGLETPSKTKNTTRSHLKAHNGSSVSSDDTLLALTPPPSKKHQSKVMGDAEDDFGKRNSQSTSPSPLKRPFDNSAGSRSRNIDPKPSPRKRLFVDDNNSSRTSTFKYPKSFSDLNKNKESTYEPPKFKYPKAFSFPSKVSTYGQSVNELDVFFDGTAPHGSNFRNAGLPKSSSTHGERGLGTTFSYGTAPSAKLNSLNLGTQQKAHQTAQFTSSLFASETNNLESTDVQATKSEIDQVTTSVLETQQTLKSTEQKVIKILQTLTAEIKELKAQNEHLTQKLNTLRRDYVDSENSIADTAKQLNDRIDKSNKHHDIKNEELLGRLDELEFPRAGGVEGGMRGGPRARQPTPEEERRPWFGGRNQKRW